MFRKHISTLWWFKLLQFTLFWNWNDVIRIFQCYGILKNTKKIKGVSPHRMPPECQPNVVKCHPNALHLIQSHGSIPSYWRFPNRFPFVRTRTLVTRNTRYDRWLTYYVHVNNTVSLTPHLTSLFGRSRTLSRALPPNSRTSLRFLFPSCPYPLQSGSLSGRTLIREHRSGMGARSWW